MYYRWVLGSRKCTSLVGLRAVGAIENLAPKDVLYGSEKRERRCRRGGNGDVNFSVR